MVVVQKILAPEPHILDSFPTQQVTRVEKRKKREAAPYNSMSLWSVGYLKLGCDLCVFKMEF
jgi:hypothetical protein